MSVHCLFFIPGQQQPCQVLRALGVEKVQKIPALRLRSRYCQSGSFIACPIFCRVEQRLVEANHLRLGLWEGRSLMDSFGCDPHAEPAPAASGATLAAARRN